MFKTIKGNPRRVILQKCSRKNNWVDIGTYIDSEGITYTKALNLITGASRMENPDVRFETRLNTKYRLIVRGKKSDKELLVMSSLNSNLFRSLYERSTSSQYVILVDGKTLYSNSGNPYMTPIKKLMEWTWEHGGIYKGNIRTSCKEDGGLATWDVEFMDGEKHTFSYLYTR